MAFVPGATPPALCGRRCEAGDVINPAGAPPFMVLGYQRRGDDAH
jgi:hypothetical protein